MDQVKAVMSPNQIRESIADDCQKSKYSHSEWQIATEGTSFTTAPDLPIVLTHFQFRVYPVGK